jgi:Helix-turn-helix domain
MPNNQNKRGRAKRRPNGPKFIQLFRYMLDSPAYISLSLAARAALIEVTRGYDGSNNGRIVLSARGIAERMNCCRNTAMRALQELVEKGFIEPRTRGAYSVKFRRATEWRLNDRRCDVTGKAQSQAFLKWSGDVQGSAEPQATSASRAKPWRVLNMSRAKWYRLGKPVPEAMRETVRQSA